MDARQIAKDITDQILFGDREIVIHEGPDWELRTDIVTTDGENRYLRIACNHFSETIYWDLAFDDEVLEEVIDRVVTRGMERR